MYGENLLKLESVFLSQQHKFLFETATQFKFKNRKSLTQEKKLIKPYLVNKNVLIYQQFYLANEKILEMIILHGGQINLRDYIEGNTPLHLAAAFNGK